MTNANQQALTVDIEACRRARLKIYGLYLEETELQHEQVFMACFSCLDRMLGELAPFPFPDDPILKRIEAFQVTGRVFLVVRGLLEARRDCGVATEDEEEHFETLLDTLYLGITPEERKILDTCHAADQTP